MNALALLASQLVALALGSAVMALLIAPRAGAVAVRLGYGYVLGSVGIALLLRGSSAATIKWSFPVVAIVAIVCALALYGGKRWHSKSMAGTGPSPDDRNALFWILAALVAIHGGLALAEAWMRPLFPWDATTHWATKARVWYEFRGIVPFVDDMTWVKSTGAIYSDAHPNYPATIPLLQVWAALAYGSFDDTVVNIGWPLTLIAMAAGIYGQMRRLDLGSTAAMATAFAVVSMPFVDIHAALAGYADLALGALYAFAVLSLACYARTRGRNDLVVTLLCALALPLMKAPGWAWLATILSGLIAVHLPRRIMVGLTLAGIVGGVAFALIAANAGLSIMGYRFQAFSLETAWALLDNLYAADSWHLLGIAVPLAIVFAHRAIATAAALPVAIALLAGAAFLLAVFFFSNTSEEGVTTATTVNRALLHWVPALVAYLAWVVADAAKQRFGSSPTLGGATAGTGG